MNKERLLRLADHLKTVDPKDYTITTFGKDALFHAAWLPEFKKAGLRVVVRTNDNTGKAEPGGIEVMYKGYKDITAAVHFFGLTDIQAQYLLGDREIDITGQPHPAPCGSTRDKGQSRDTEWPTWTAARIEAFVRNPTVDYLNRVPKAA